MLTGYKTYLTAAASIVIAWLSVYLHQMDAQAAVQMTSAALLAAFLRHGVASSAPALALLLVTAVAACSSTGVLSPTTQKLATIGCAVDMIAQPIGLPFISGIPTVGGIAATADAALIHPLVVKACADLAASLGTGSAKPVVLP